jgi:hypothetical protein
MTAVSIAPPLSPDQVAALADELRRRAAEDRRLASATAASPTPRLADRYRTCCRANADALQKIIGRHGWPTRDLVADEAATAALMIALHAGHDPSFQRRCRDLVADAVRASASPAIHLAYLEDVCAVGAGQPQPYGTQVTWRDGATVAYPIRDPQNLDARRSEVGLPAHGEFTQQLTTRISRTAAPSAASSRETTAPPPQPPRPQPPVSRPVRLSR